MKTCNNKLNFALEYEYNEIVESCELEKGHTSHHQQTIENNDIIVTIMWLWRSGD